MAQRDVKIDSVTIIRLKDQPASQLPRERLVDKGPDALSPGELVAILLRTGLKGVNVVELGTQVVHKYGSLQALAKASIEDLKRFKGIGRDKAPPHRPPASSTRSPRSWTPSSLRPPRQSDRAPPRTLLYSAPPLRADRPWPALS